MERVPENAKADDPDRGKTGQAADERFSAGKRQFHAADQFPEKTGESVTEGEGVNGDPAGGFRIQGKGEHGAEGERDRAEDKMAFIPVARNKSGDIRDYQDINP